jgi:hypothetical protein
MKTVSKEQLEIFTSYMEDEIPVDSLMAFIEAKARIKSEDTLRTKELMNLVPMDLI